MGRLFLCENGLKLVVSVCWADVSGRNHVTCVKLIIIFKNIMLIHVDIIAFFI